MKPVRFHVGAEKELQEIQRYYEARQTGLGDRWLKTVEEAVRRLQEKPTHGRPARFGTRKCRLGRFPYYLIFIPRPTDLFVVPLMHEKREPDYWATRL